MFQDFNMDVSNLSRSRWVVVTYIFDKKSLMLVISLYMSIPLNLTFIYCQLKFRINEKRLNETHGNIRFSVYLSNWMKSKWCCIKFNSLFLFYFYLIILMQLPFCIIQSTFNEGMLTKVCSQSTPKFWSLW